MFDREQHIAMHLQMAKDLGWEQPPDVIDKIMTGGLLVTGQAAEAE